MMAGKPMQPDDIARIVNTGFARRVGFGARPALLLTDLISGFTDRLGRSGKR